MVVESEAYISVQDRVIAEFGGTGPEALDNGTPVLKRTRRSTLYIAITFDGDPGPYELGLSQSLDGINYFELEAGIVGTDDTPILKTYVGFAGSFVQPFQISKTNDVNVSFTARLV